ncbi:MAG: chromosomal replication initiator protein DnaA [Opitutales bacterium]
MKQFSNISKHNEIWDLALNELKNSLSADIFSEFFEQIQLESSQDDHYVFSAEGEFAAIWIKDNYADLIRRTISIVLGSNATVEICARQAELVQIPKRETPKVEVPRFVEKKAKSPNINPRNTFENFIIGEGNMLAHAAALATASAPGRTYNPLCLYGATGLGKTHLMHAIAHFIFKNNPNSSILYTTSERFINEYIRDVMDKNFAQFRKRYRNVDVLMIDDIQLFAGKQKCQDEFFHTFNDLQEAGKQIILTSDRPFNEIPDIEQRLISRFEWGFSADIQSPDYETRYAILTKKAENMGLSLSPDIFDLLARRITKNVRRLEGALNKLSGYSLYVKDDLTVEKATQLLADTLRQEETDGKVDIARIQEITAKYLDIDLADMSSRRRPAKIAMARQIAMYIAKKHTKKSFDEIGKAFGGRDHATVMYAMNTIETLMTQDASVKSAVAYLQNSLNS